MIEAIKRFVLKKKPAAEAENKILIDVSTEQTKSPYKHTKVSVDLSEMPDIVGDIITLSFLKDNSVDFILANSTLNTLNRNQYQAAINNWHRVLKEGGMLNIILPDIINTAVRFSRGEIKDSTVVVDAIYGKEKAYHNGFWFSRLERALKSAKFRKVVLAKENKMKDKTIIYVKGIK